MPFPGNLVQYGAEPPPELAVSSGLADRYQDGGDLAGLGPGDVVDEQVRLALTVRRGSGPALAVVGHRLATITTVDDTTARAVEGLLREALSVLVRDALIRIEGVDVEAADDEVAAEVRYTNLLTGAERSQRAVVPVRDQGRR